MSPPEARRGVAIEVHDVAPATWAQCAAILEMLDAQGASPVTLLVVPHFHRGTAIGSDAAFAHALAQRLARGDELALHGYYHLDEEPAPRSLRGYVERRLFTRAEGEFAALDESGAAERLVRGAASFQALGFPLHGFVPPAWLLGEDARRALTRQSNAFEYVALRHALHRLPDWRPTHSATLWYSPDRGWRRALSRALIACELARARSEPLLRFALHPRDARAPQVMRHWRTLVAEALAQRQPLTQRAAVQTM